MLIRLLESLLLLLFFRHWLTFFLVFYLLLFLTFIPVFCLWWFVSSVEFLASKNQNTSKNGLGQMNRSGECT